MQQIHFETIDSTNSYLKENYSSLDNFTFVSASFQSEGKGRLDRNWISKKSENLLFSFLIKDKELLKKYKALSIGTASLVACFLEIKGLKNVMIKWPNDIYVNGKKICGILLEGNVNEYLVIGVGLNVNQTKFDGDYRVNPTSIKNELNIETDLDEFKTELFKFLEKHIKQKSFEQNTLSFFKFHDYLIGKEVNGGIVQGIDSNFDIIIDGKAISSGEIDENK